MDSFGHINNSVFLSYLEDARIHLLNRWNLTDEKSVIVASIKINYLKQLRHPSNLIIGQKISSLGNKSFKMQSGIFLNGSTALIAESKVTLVCFNYKTCQTVQIFNEIVEDYNNL